MAKTHTGDLTAQPGVVYDCEVITGWLSATGADTRTAFPKLTTVGGWLSATGADTRTAFPKLTTVGGTLDASGADTRTAFPTLTTVGGWLDATGADTRTAFPKLTHTNDAAAHAAALAKKGLALHDGILSRIIRQRGPVTVVQRIGQTRQSYVVTDGTHTAHGDTLAEARADLRLKQTGQDTSAFRAWSRRSVRSQEDLVLAYRAITGACGAGVRQFLAGQSLPARLTVQRAIDVTRGQYGHAAFAGFAWKETA